MTVGFIYCQNKYLRCDIITLGLGLSLISSIKSGTSNPDGGCSVL